MSLNQTNTMRKPIPAHVFKHSGKYFLFDISTTFCFEIDEITYDVVRNYFTPGMETGENLNDKYGCEGVEAAVSDIEMLIDKKLFNDSEGRQLSPAAVRNISSIELHVIHSCNMNCVYCYGDGGSYGSEAKYMDIATAKRSVDFLIENSEDIKELSLVFFGGEPLMNLDVVFETARYAREACREKGKKVLFSMTTNGTLLDKDIIQRLRKNRISFMISMDGGKKEQDYLRPLRNGESSYTKIKSNMNEIKGRQHINVRSTLTKANLDILQLIEEFKMLGFSGCHLSTVNTSNASLSLDENDYAYLIKQYDTIAEEILESIKNEKIPDFRVNSIFLTIDRLYSAQRRVLPCGAGKNMLCISPDGGLYLCHRFAENDEYKLGNIFDGIDWDKKDMFATSPVMKDANCSTCWIRNICAGGCWHSRLDADTNKMLETIPNSLECDMKRHIYELSMVIYNEIMEHPGLMERLSGKNAASDDKNTNKENITA